MLCQNLLVWLASIAVASAAAADKCNADNCLRAIRATGNGITTRLPAASSDCSSFLAGLTTITYTDTQTFSTTSTSTSHVTTTSTVHATATQTLSLTSILTVNPLDTTITALRKRATATVTSVSLPPYASPCSGTARFSSACSCIGVISAPPRSTTVTVLTTLSYSTVVTVTDTTTITTTDATKTETSVVTMTTAVAVLPTEYKILATFVSTGEQKYLMLTTFLNFLMIGLTSDITAASVFRLDGTKLTSGSTHGTMNSSQYGYIFMQPATPLSGLTDISCTIDATRQISCVRGTSTVIVQAGPDPVLALSDPTNVSSQQLSVIKLTALI